VLTAEMRRFACITSSWLRPGRRLRDERGFTLIELLIAVSMLGVVLLAAFAALNSFTQDASSDQAFAGEVQDAQTGIERITHDLRTAYSIVTAEPNLIEFYQWAYTTVNGTTQQVTEDVEYDCAVPQPGTAYDECTRVQSIYPAPLPSPSTGEVIAQRLENGGVATYCSSNSVFHYLNGSGNGSSASCTEANAVAESIDPVFVEVRVLVPAKGYLTGVETGLQHTTVLDAGAMLRNVTLTN
jgi:prepilin-type N-terminal cleavage/methylation domain-containing protein